MTLKETASGTGTVAKEVNLSLGDGASGKNFEVELESSTVTVSSTNGTPVEIGKMTAATAANTLIIDKGVTIKELIVAKGNVKYMEQLRKFPERKVIPMVLLL